MVKAYLKYQFDGTCGAVTGQHGPILSFENFFVTSCSQYLVLINRKSGKYIAINLR